MTRALLLLAVCFASLSASARAATLYGTVIEINDGDTVTILNLNKPVIVRVIGIDAPDGQQPYADVAVKHLSDLIAGKFVSVEYSGFVQNNYLLGTVSHKEMDIGAQMIRDGVAWVDPETSSRLSAALRELYRESERAARAEHRGLWQDTDPVAPWKFKEQQKSAARSQSGNPPTVQSSFDATLAKLPPAPTSVMNEWHTFSPEKARFKVTVPGIGNEAGMEMPVGTGVAKFEVWAGKFEDALYMVMWARGPNVSYTDDAALEDIRAGVLRSLNASSESRGVPFEFRQHRILKVGPLTGVQYDISSGNDSGVVRVYSRRVGDERELYMLLVVNADERSPSVTKFLSSFSFVPKK